MGMDYIEITMDLEDRFGISLQPDDWDRVGVSLERDHTVADLCRVVVHKIRLARPELLIDTPSTPSTDAQHLSKPRHSGPFSVPQVSQIVKQVLGKVLHRPVNQIADDMLLNHDLGIT